MTTLSFESANAGDSGNGQLLRDIEEISKALYLPKASHRPLASFLSAGSELAGIARLPHSSSKRDLDFRDNGERKPDRDKKFTVWPWKPLKALSHIWRRKFNCRFFCHIHHIENLPSAFDGLDMIVHWKRKDNLLRTQVSRVSSGFVEFEDTLSDKCSVFGARSGAGNFVKYEPKHFLLYASVVGSEGLDIGKHWIDLTRLLPLVVEDLEEDKGSEKWTTSFKLGGEAKGATLHVSFWFHVMTNGLIESDESKRLPLVFNSKQNSSVTLDGVASFSPGSTSNLLRRVSSVPSSLGHGSSSSSQCSDVKELHQVWPNPDSEFLGSVDFLYRKLDEGDMGLSFKCDSGFESSESHKLFTSSCFEADKGVSGKKHCCSSDDDGGADFTVTERGIELEWPIEEQLKEDSAAGKMEISSSDASDAAAEMLKDEVRISDKENILNPVAKGSNGSVSIELFHSDTFAGEVELDTKELDLNIQNQFLESLESESLVFDGGLSEEAICDNMMPNLRVSKSVDSLSLEVAMKTVADDFLNLLGEKNDSSNLSKTSDCDSPRERLWKEFEDDAVASGSFLFDSDVPGVEDEFICSLPDTSCSDIVNQAVFQFPVIQNAAVNLAGSQETSSKTKLQALECLETQSLMQRWGFDEETFQCSPDSCTGGFGSPIYLPPDEPAELPPLGEGSGPVLELNDGGFLLSMSSSLFKGSKDGGVLTIQFSRPAVLPADMGSGVLEVLENMASEGLETMSKQAHDLMPLTDLSGKIIEQLASEVSCPEEMPERLECLQHESCVKLEAWGYLPSLTSKGDGSGCEYMSVKNLVLLVMDSIGCLSIEGLRIQSGMSNLVAPASVNVKHESDNSAATKNGDCVQNSAEEGDGLQLSTPSRTGENVAPSMRFSLALDEWLRLDSGVFDDGDYMRRIAAHHAKSSMRKMVQGNMGGEASLQCGLLGDDLVVALMIQLRNPLRNFESVGAPMLALIQVKRNFDNLGLALDTEPPELEEGIDECFTDRSKGGNGIARFVLKEVHVAGLIAEPDSEEIWASRRQQQSGCRWLLANDMNNKSQKTNKSQLPKSNAIVRFSNVLKKQQFENILWSISSKPQGFSEHPSDISLQDPYLRNPDIMFS